MVDEKLADTTGVRVRWDDANTLIRQMAGEGGIRWETTVTQHSVDHEGKVTVTLRHSDGTVSTEGDFDLLVGAEGRYSPVRARAMGEPSTNFGSVCNFRILVPNCQPDGAPWPVECPTGLFHDLQLLYNETPTMDSLAEESTLRADTVFTRCVLRSCPRVGVMRIPQSQFKDGVGESLYIFGNFAIPAGGQIPEASKTAEAMHCLFTPSEGDEALTPEGRFVRETLVRHAERLHWARFQDIPVTFHPYDAGSGGRVLLLGDAAHAFCPSLGQGASTSIEDACVAADSLAAVIDAAGGSRAVAAAVVPAALAKVSARQAARVEFIRDASTEAGEHLRFGQGETCGRSALDDDAKAWSHERRSSVELAAEDEAHVAGLSTPQYGCGERVSLVREEQDDPEALSSRRLRQW